MDESKLSSEALQEDPADSKEDVQGVINGDNEEFDELGKEDDVVAGGVEGEFGDIKPNGQLKELPPIEAQPVALNSGQLSGSYPSSDVATSSQLLSEVPVDFDGQQPLELAEFKVKVEVSQLQTPLSVATESAQTHLHSQIQSSGCPTFSSELSPTSVTESISSASPAFPDQKLSSATKTNDSLFPEVQQHNSSKPKPISADGFNWRKYGQKQVKLPQGSRSYYKCTYPNCHAKKTERSDHLNNVIETIPKGEHNHDPPPRTSSTKENILSLPTPPQEGELKESDPPTPGLDELKQLTFSGSYEIVEFDGKKEFDDRPEQKRRLKKSNPVSSKKRKIVIHAEGDVDIAGDGYRWRKYGQKMVKGSPHPRNYYRCTSAGCPVRKHLERAKDDTGNVMITYKGLHDHDMPVPKKGQGPQSASLLAAQASVNSLQLEKNGDNQVFDAQWLLESGGAPTGAGEEVAATGGGEEIMALDAAEEVDAGEEMVVDGGEEVAAVGREMAAMEPSRTQPIKQC